MTDPLTTEAGRILNDVMGGDLPDLIENIEKEAAAAERRRIAERIRAELADGDTSGWDSTYSAELSVSADRLLAFLEET